jgi:D-serine deaminase-like pyridoxal phosphate-dependent protein
MITYHFEQEERIPSPALIYYRDEIEANTRKAIEMAGGAARMWPHVKTHKMAEMIRMQVDMGIRRFKCATVSEIRMTAAQGAEHILWAYPILGPNVKKFLELVQEFPACTLYALEDDFGALKALSDAAQAQGMCVNVLLDVNVGMDRTGMPLENVIGFYRTAAARTGVKIRGLHCYDGLIHDHDLAARQAHADGGAEKAHAVRMQLREEGFDINRDITVATALYYGLFTDTNAFGELSTEAMVPASVPTSPSPPILTEQFVTMQL